MISAVNVNPSSTSGLYQQKFQQMDGLMDSGTPLQNWFGEASMPFWKKIGTYFDNKMTGSQDVQNSLTLQHDAQKFDAYQAQLNRDWQKMMSDTSYQRAAADLKAAGFNPALLLGSGAPSASTPSGSAAHSAIGHANPIRGFDGLLSSIFGLVGALVSTGMKTSAYEAAQDLRGQYSIDVAKLKNNNAVLISNAKNAAAMDRSIYLSKEALKRVKEHNKGAMDRVKVSNDAAMDRVVQAGKGNIEVAKIRGDDMRDVAERYTPEYDERLAKSDIRYIEFMRKMKAKYGYKGRK